jgi:hypothetical protein
MPQKLWAVGEEVLAADFNNYVQQQVVAVFPNAAARTAQWAAPREGAVSYLEDADGVLWIYYAGAWKANIPLGQLGWAYSATDTNIPAQAAIDLPTASVAVNPPAGRLIRVTLNVQFGGTVNTAGAIVSAAVTDLANTVLADRVGQLVFSNVQNFNTSLVVHHQAISTGTTTTFKGRAANLTAGANAIFAQDMILMVDDIGLA